MKSGLTPQKARTESKPAGNCSHSGTMSAGGGQGKKGFMGTGSSGMKPIYGAMGKHQHTGNGGG